MLGVDGVGGTPPERRLLELHTRYTAVDYPPMALYELAVVGKVYRALLPDYPNDWHLTTAVKIPGLIAGLALTLLLYLGVERLTGSRPQAQWIALAYWANPATIRNGEVLGYLDALNMNLFYGIGRGAGWAIPRMLTPIDRSVLLAAANIALLVWYGRRLVQHARPA